MGYDSRIIICEKYPEIGSKLPDPAESFDDNKARYFVIPFVTFDLCCSPNVVQAFKTKGIEANTFIYENNNKIIKDDYGDTLLQMDFDDFHEELDNIIKEDSSYWRHLVLQGIVHSILKNNRSESGFEYIVLHCGH
jgi:hypothetical protein